MTAVLAFDAPPESDAEDLVQDTLVHAYNGFRTALYYVNVDGHQYTEIAVIMGISVGTVMSRLHRGRKLLRDLLFDVVSDRGLYRSQQ